METEEERKEMIKQALKKLIEERPDLWEELKQTLGINRKED